MNDKAIQIVSFDVPFPPNYGGVIDVFYKIKALSALGVKVYLHCYFDDRSPSKELDVLCEQVYYYKRQKKVNAFFSNVPFIVRTRSSDKLIETLETIDAPILFEGLHTTYSLVQNDFKNKLKFVRMHNIEHLYYKGLYHSETNWFKKLFFWFESRKLKHYEAILEKVNKVFTISPFEQSYYKSNLGKAEYLPVFHRNTNLVSYTNQGKYALFHGDLRVADNIKSANYLIEVFKGISDKILVIASSFESQQIIQTIKGHPNISFELIKDSQHLDEVFKNAQLHIILSFQNTGIKLKLVNALYQTRYVLANTVITEGTGLSQSCEVFNSKEDLIQKLNTFYTKPFTEQQASIRRKVLNEFNTKMNAAKLAELL